MSASVVSVFACVFMLLADDPDPEGQGFCQAGFSVDFTKVDWRQLPFITQKPPAHNLSLLRVHAEKTPIKIYGQWEDQRAFVPREASTPDVTHRLVTQ